LACTDEQPLGLQKGELGTDGEHHKKIVDPSQKSMEEIGEDPGHSGSGGSTIV
jgi:hypothetical protein